MTWSFSFNLLNHKSLKELSLSGAWFWKWGESKAVIHYTEPLTHVFVVQQVPCQQHTAWNFCVWEDSSWVNCHPGLLVHGSLRRYRREGRHSLSCHRMLFAIAFVQTFHVWNLRSPTFGGPGVGHNFKPLRRTDLCESVSGGQVDYAFKVKWAGHDGGLQAWQKKNHCKGDINSPSKGEKNISRQMRQCN